MDIHRELEEAFARLIDRPWGRSESGDWQPAIDLYESGDAYYLVADLPGVDPKAIDLQVTEKAITLCGTRSTVRRINTPLRVFTERFHGQFSRTFQVTAAIDQKAVTSDYQNGVYEAYLPKLKESAT